MDRLSSSLVIPSVFPQQLEWFLERNLKYLTRCKLVIITSSKEHLEKNIRKTLAPDYKIVTIDKALGFAKTVNLGFKQATTEWVGTVNDDVELSEGWLEKLLAAARPDTGAINPVILSSKGSIESAGIDILPIGRAVPITKLDQTQPYQTTATNAACVLYRREALVAAGYFDERFGSYLEDLDLSLSMQQLGWQQLVVPTVKVVHHRHQTSHKLLGRRKASLDARNWWFILGKHWTKAQWLRYGMPILLERGRNVSGVLKSYWQ